MRLKEIFQKTLNFLNKNIPGIAFAISFIVYLYMNAPTQERRMSYEIKRQELLNGGATLYDIQGLDSIYTDVIEFKKREEDRRKEKKE